MYYGKFHLPEWATLCPLQEYYRHSTINYTSIKALFSVLHPLPQLYIYGRMDRSGPNAEESNRNLYICKTTHSLTTIITANISLTRTLQIDKLISSQQHCIALEQFTARGCTDNIALRSNN